jgi:hypothetical protein
MKDSSSISNQFSTFPWKKFFPDILWVLLWLAVFLIFHKVIRNVINAFISRLKHGAAVKIGSFELEGLKVTQDTGIQSQYFRVSSDDAGDRENERSQIYNELRGAMLVHKIYKSESKNQLYDILIYVVPKKDCNIIQVTSVEYYFGKFWNNKVFTATDRSNGFAIATSAYGSFLCTARINFNDGTFKTAYRFIDFEMGGVAGVSKKDSV